MRLEVMIGNSDTLIHPIKGNRVLIGSSESCDIVLPAKNISRKHLVVVAENDQYFVIDQGSTNGSYINEERLIPGRRVEFTSFFPVRLGDDVLISLLSDDEPMDDGPESSLEASLKPETNPPASSSDHEATSVISLKHLKEVKTDHLIKRREERRKQAKKRRTVAPPPPPKKKIKIDYIKLFAFFLLAGAAYYHFFVLTPEPENIPVEPVVKRAPPVKPIPPEVQFHLVAKEDLPTHEQVTSMVSNMKCVTDVEQYFCQAFPGQSEAPFGSYQVGTMIYVHLDAASYIESTSKLVSFPDPAVDTNPERFKLIDLHAKNVMALNFIINTIPQDLKTDLVPGLKLTFAFYTMKEAGPELYFLLTVTPEAIEELRKKIQPELFQELRTPGNFISNMAAQYYHLY